MDADWLLLWGLLGGRTSWKRASNGVKKADVLMTVGSLRS